VIRLRRALSPIVDPCVLLAVVIGLDASLLNTIRSMWPSPSTSPVAASMPQPSGTPGFDVGNAPAPSPSSTPVHVTTSG
jgi:hypothetical protein